MRTDRLIKDFIARHNGAGAKQNVGTLLGHLAEVGNAGSSMGCSLEGVSSGGRK